jgi:hypothetical protein
VATSLTGTCQKSIEEEISEDGPGHGGNRQETVEENAGTTDVSVDVQFTEQRDAPLGRGTIREHEHYVVAQVANPSVEELEELGVVIEDEAPKVTLVPSGTNVAGRDGRHYARVWLEDTEDAHGVARTQGEVNVKLDYRETTFGEDDKRTEVRCELNGNMAAEAFDQVEWVGPEADEDFEPNPEPEQPEGDYVASAMAEGHCTQSIEELQGESGPGHGETPLPSTVEPDVNQEDVQVEIQFTNRKPYEGLRDYYDFTANARVMTPSFENIEAPDELFPQDSYKAEMSHNTNWPEVVQGGGTKMARHVQVWIQEGTHHGEDHKKGDFFIQVRSNTPFGEDDRRLEVRCDLSGQLSAEAMGQLDWVQAGSGSSSAE